MKTLTPIFQYPEYERPQHGCEVQARWPDLVATARSSALTSEEPVFYEFAPLPGGLFLAGVGYRKARSADRSEPSLREAILGRMVAGHRLGESIQASLEECERDCSDVSVRYVVIDPVLAKAEIHGHGHHASALHITNGVTRPLGPPLGSGRAISRHMTMRPGDALVLAAHPGTWNKYALCAVDRAVTTPGGHLSEREALQVCGRTQGLIIGDSASVVIHRSDAGGP